MRRFRHLHRLTAVVVQLLLLQFAFAGSAGACPLGDGGARHAGMQMAGTSAPGGQHHPLNTDGPANRASATPASHHHAGMQCDMACPPASCGSAGHCSATAMLDGMAAARPLALARDGASVRGDAALRSVSTAPEPPPPRA